VYSRVLRIAAALWRDWNGTIAPLGGLVPAPGTSPDIAADNNGGWEVALHGANTHFLWTIDSTGRTDNTMWAMQAGAHNPAIAGIPAPDGIGLPTNPPPLPAIRTFPVALSPHEPAPTGPNWYDSQYPSIGSTPSGHLLQIQVTGSPLGPMVALKFVKIGHTPQECNSNPDATVQINVGQTTTPAQLAAIYCAAEPAFDTAHPLPLVACYVGSGSPLTRTVQATFQLN
jgi:hypothetical protein